MILPSCIDPVLYISSFVVKITRKDRLIYKILDNHGFLQYMFMHLHVDMYREYAVSSELPGILRGKLSDVTSMDYNKNL